jgi:hypothetical protein
MCGTRTDASAGKRKKPTWRLAVVRPPVNNQFCGEARKPRRTSWRRALPAEGRYGILGASKNVRNHCRCGKTHGIEYGHAAGRPAPIPDGGAASGQRWPVPTLAYPRDETSDFIARMALRLPTPTRRMGLRRWADAPMTEHDERIQTLTSEPHRQQRRRSQAPRRERAKQLG